MDFILIAIDYPVAQVVEHLFGCHVTCILRSGVQSLVCTHLFCGHLVKISPSPAVLGQSFTYNIIKVSNWTLEGQSEQIPLGLHSDSTGIGLGLGLTKHNHDHIIVVLPAPVSHLIQHTTGLPIYKKSAACIADTPLASL